MLRRDILALAGGAGISTLELCSVVMGLSVRHNGSGEESKASVVMA
jgi:hypothetical protein